MQPAIVSFDDDSTWGQPNGLRYPVTNGNFLIPKGRLLTDVILDRVENSMWQWQISDFRAKSLFFTSHAIAKWNVTESTEGTVDVVFSYRYFASHWSVFPVLWGFAVIQVRGMLQNALTAIKQYAESDKPMVYT
ncbi:hypothetical protein SV7mr_24730 [Stieleria bergensis]|uniref:Polyketide cyclase / dehydrase and lipid transport n=1 Tax=Stieleria bergensis TaxID=2528025 RepID=A0A517SV11_9BACT|nr:hypothetical protein SV7mr_24730 [Planctomycetes bacterium SV_7m_r]